VTFRSGVYRAPPLLSSPRRCRGCSCVEGRSCLLPANTTSHGSSDQRTPRRSLGSSSPCGTSASLAGGLPPRPQPAATIRQASCSGLRHVECRVIGDVVPTAGHADAHAAALPRSVGAKLVDREHSPSTVSVHCCFEIRVQSIIEVWHRDVMPIGSGGRGLLLKTPWNRPSPTRGTERFGTRWDTHKAWAPALIQERPAFARPFDGPARTRTWDRRVISVGGTCDLQCFQAFSGLSGALKQTWRGPSNSRLGPMSLAATTTSNAIASSTDNGKPSHAVQWG
jgi:hypothetical protein